MPVSYETLNRELYDVLRSRNYDPISLDATGTPTDDTDSSDVMSFTVKDGDEQIKAWATVEGDSLVLYVDDKFTETDDWEPFATFMKRWAQKKTLKFKISNRDRLLGDMKKRAIMNKKEQVLEGYHAMGRKASYNDAIPQVKIVLQHTRQLEEGEQRFRNIAKIFVENQEGERFLLPTNRPGLARVYARHIAEGGTPYDDKGRHITTLVEEYQKMAGFVRATRNGQFNESALVLVNEGLKHYNDLRMTLQGMASHRGYNNYFESYTPVLNEETDDDVSLNELFVQETLDPRIESVMPILKRLSKNINEMSAVKELEEWAQSITEVEDETTKTLAVPADEMLDEADIGDPDGTGQRAYDRKHLAKDVDVLDKLEKKALDKAKSMTSLPPKKIKEAPGAETLAHDDATEKSNLKAFDLDEGFSPSSEVADQIVDSLGGEEGYTSDDIYRAVEEYQSMMDNPEKLDVEEVVQIVMDKMDVTEIDEAFRYYYPGATKSDIKNKVKKFKHGVTGFEEDVSEDLDADQKRAGQLGPTEKVGPKGAVGKLVGTSESREFEDIKRLAGLK
jgi:hypothetical protein